MSVKQAIRNFTVITHGNTIYRPIDVFGSVIVSGQAEAITAIKVLFMERPVQDITYNVTHRTCRVHSQLKHKQTGKC